MIKKQYEIPVEVILEAAELLNKYKVLCELQGKGHREGTLKLNLTYDPKLHFDVIDNLEYMIEEFNSYRYGVTENLSSNEGE